MRDTKHNATVTTLLEMFLAANPDKGRTEAEKEGMKVKYSSGENVLVKVGTGEMSLRERRVEDADRRLVEATRELSLREVGVEDPTARRERRRAERSRDPSRDTHSSSREAEERERERRRRREEGERRRARDDGTLGVGTDSGAEERRRRRSNEERRTRRHEETSRTAARQVEHQSSLRSLISTSDIDSREMEEEILRQIREEGLLDGIDLENLDVNQEDQISERIAQAFRRRQAERSRQEPARRSNNSGQDPARRSDTNIPESGRRSDHSERRREGRSSAPDSRETSGDDGARTSSRTRRTRTHSRTPSAVSADGQTATHGPSRPPQSTSAAQAALLDVHSGDEARHRRRRTGSSTRSATDPVPVLDMGTRPAARSQTDLSNRPHSMTSPTSIRPLFASTSRNSTDPSVQPVELPASESSPRTSQNGFNSSPRLNSGTRMENTPGHAQTASNSSPRTSGARLENAHAHTAERRTRAAPPADITVPPSSSAASSQPQADRSLMPTPLSPREVNQTTLSERANAITSGSRPSSSSSNWSRSRRELYHEPSITCARCAKPHIEYELHYNCGICSEGTYNICLDCYRRDKGCLHWYGFGYAAWRKWETLNQSGDLEPPHMLKASRYMPPRIAPGGADGRRTLTTEDPEKRLQSGTFCANCLAWANECYWLCNMCNEGDWGFCNICVNQGKSCTHPLLPLKYEPPASATPPLSPTHDQQTPPSASILTGPGVMSFGNFKPLTFKTACDICRHPIQPSSSRYHCFSCTSRVPNTLPGDYDICTTCYPRLVTSRRISPENGFNGWRRCLQGHRMVIVGFEDSHGGQRRVVVQDLVGGRGIIDEPYTSAEFPDTTLMKWKWGDGVHIRGDHTHVKLVTADVMRTSPTHASGLVLDTAFPPDGGVGMIAQVIWAWYPAPGADDELMFPKGAVVKECKDVNGDWFHGTYMGKRGLFPAPFVKILDRGHA